MHIYPDQAEKLQSIKDNFEYPTVVEFARELGFSQSTVSGYLKGKSSVELLLSLNRCYGISPNWYLLEYGPQFLEQAEDQPIDPGVVRSEAMGWEVAERLRLAIDLIQSTV